MGAALDAARRLSGLVLLLLSTASASADIELPLADVNAPVIVAADRAYRWEQGAYEVWHLQGNCTVSQDQVVARAGEAVLWIERAEPFRGQISNVLAYLEGTPERPVVLEYDHQGPAHRATGRASQLVTDRTWFGQFRTLAEIQMRVPVASVAPDATPAVFHRGMEAQQAASEPNARLAQFEQLPAPAPQAVAPPQAAARRIRILPRGGAPFNTRSEPSRTRNEFVTIIDSGIKVVIEDVQLQGAGPLGTVVIETDRMVVWTESSLLTMGGDTLQRGDMPLELYLEGNIVFRQGDRVIYAERMYYNVPGDYGIVLSAEMLTPVDDYQGLVRLKAEVLQQLNRQNFQAYGAALTSSRMGVPRYWLQSEQIQFQDVQQPLVAPFTGAPVIDPRTGEQALEHEMLATSRNNFLYAGGAPIFYWPVLSTDLTDPVYYIDEISVRNDNVFGFQVLTEFDLYQLLNIVPREGTEWDLSIDTLSERGIGLGTTFAYERPGPLFNIPGPYEGLFDAWGIDEQGLDNLGADRLALEPEEDLRGRVFLQHRQYLPNGYQFTGEVGLISDRNFLEQYYEEEWDELKDQSTGFQLKRYNQNSSWSIWADAQVNDFFTETQWLPRYDHYLIGQSIFGRLTWHAHSHVAFADLEPATVPLNPSEQAKFLPRPYEVDREGIHTATRHEIDYPIQLGAVKVVPYVLGELAHWGETLDAEDITRAYGQVGVRGSVPMWRVDPTVQSQLLNLNGLAHKVTFYGEYFAADADETLTRFPLYEQLDDNAQEHFRRRYPFDIFGGTPIPARFDERFYALRTGMQSHVVAASTEIADDLTIARLGVSQRWQTKRGLPGQERIIDWIELDVEGSFFPDPERDNFGEEAGLLEYDFRWHLGDRFTLLSDGFADVFEDGLRTASIGGILSRPRNGQVFLGFRSIEGPITSSILNASVSYRTSEKWIVTAGTSFDFGPTGSIGQTLSFTRIGESALVEMGFTLDESRDSLGVIFSIEPRFLPGARLARLGGEAIPPAGVEGLE